MAQKISSKLLELIESFGMSMFSEWTWAEYHTTT
jgi:hypothetical protein